MSLHVQRLPDVGEGVAEAELVAWHVAVGDTVTPDTVVAEVLTDKATVEVYAPVAGTIAALHGEPGEVLAVGSDFVAIETGSDAPSPAPAPAPAPAPDPAPAPAPVAVAAEPEAAPVVSAPASEPHSSVEAAPAVRLRARRLGIDLATVQGTGPGGRVTHEDLDRLGRSEPAAAPAAAPAPAPAAPAAAPAPAPRTVAPTEGSTTTPVIGLRRKIAESMMAANRIPHITYVDEVDMTNVEQLRRSLEREHPQQPHLTVLPFLMRAIVIAVRDQPHLNSTYDDAANELTTHATIDIGVATQTDHGLVVPVVRGAQALDIWGLAGEVQRVTGSARGGTAGRNELSGSTISITSLGSLGGLVTTPLINQPEVAIIGVNKMQTRPQWNGSAFVPRTMMNLSSSFDHRIIDGWDAATFVQRIKTLLEEPALLVMAG